MDRSPGTKSVRAANATVQGLALRNWVIDNLLNVESWYTREHGVLTLTIECLGGDLFFSSEISSVSDQSVFSVFGL